MLINYRRNFPLGHDVEPGLRDSYFFLMGYVEERLWWSIQSPNKGRKRQAKRKERSDQGY